MHNSTNSATNGWPTSLEVGESNPFLGSRPNAEAMGHPLGLFRLGASSACSDDRRGGVVFRVGNREKYSSNTKLSGEAGGLAAEGHDGAAQGVGEDLHVGPGDSTPPAGSDHFEDCFLGRESTGDEGNRVFELLGAF